MSFDDSFLIVMAEEGVKINPEGYVIDSGYSNDPNDSGGETKFGISARFLGRSPKDLTLIGAKSIYQVDFWNACGCDKVSDISQGLALMLFDCCVNQGPTVGTKLLQKAVGVTPDGVIGPITLSKITIDRVEKILLDFALARIERYNHLALIDPKDMKFLCGWIIRVFNVLRNARTKL